MRSGRVVRVIGWLLVVVTVLAVAGGVAGMVFGNRATDRAHVADARAARLVRNQRLVVATIDTTNHRADAPIGKAEQVANALSHIDEAASNVLVEAGSVQDALGEAVGRENNGGPGAGRSIYDGAAADAVARLQAVLQRAQVTLAAAIQAAAELRASAL